ncbi:MULTISPECIES: hypothetical protein [Limnospira]|uniref:Toxin-antitoxin system HicB family antitoxin n=3 Tax=Limnospira TaxID=2596745 RepID=A0A9P1KK64_9CYAN|nr:MULTISPECIES: hypothetical protein [Limnospira]EDZ92052.1 hypothetical protein AmaxDRAFT_5198 [Limnospira maxima CS-328]MDC0836128.1 hypothetical protein [Limnoraphis robusta]UWU46443.1 hypothetical protein APLC1_1154 [Arthrospira platensis C1]CDM97742.1 conserved protein of unknown function [Limnospira indica PCC 8005]
MSDLIVKIPDSLYKQVAELGERESISLNQMVAIAFSAQVSPWMTQDYVVEPAKQGNWEQFKQVLSKVPLVPPEEVVVRFLKWRSQIYPSSDQIVPPLQMVVFYKIFLNSAPKI